MGAGEQRERKGRKGPEFDPTSAWHFSLELPSQSCGSGSGRESLGVKENGYREGGRDSMKTGKMREKRQESRRSEPATRRYEYALPSIRRWFFNRMAKGKRAETYLGGKKGHRVETFAG